MASMRGGKLGRRDAVVPLAWLQQMGSGGSKSLGWGLAREASRRWTAPKRTCRCTVGCTATSLRKPMSKALIFREAAVLPAGS